MEKIKMNLTHNSEIAQIILDDGKGNVLDSLMMKELHIIFMQLKSHQNVKCMTIEGAGKHFSFGASVPEHTKANAATMLKNFHQLFFDIIDLGIPYIAKISGQCLGGGMELALIANQIFCDETAKFGQPEIVLGVFAPPASLLLPMKIGQTAADDLLLSGRVINSAEAKSIGLVTSVSADKDELNSATDAWIEANLLPKSASSLRFAVRSARSVFNKNLKRHLPKLEKSYVNKLMETEDANEGIGAFLEKRQAIWKNT